MKEFWIDFSKPPQVPTGWQLKKHQLEGRVVLWIRPKVLYLNYQPIRLYTTSQQCKSGILGFELLKKVRRKHPMNANLIDVLLHLNLFHLLPEKMQAWRLFFPGTIYYNAAGYECIRCLHCEDGNWKSGSRVLCHKWHAQDLVVLTPPPRKYIF